MDYDLLLYKLTKWSIIVICALILNLITTYFVTNYARETFMAERFREMASKLRTPVTFVFRTTDETDYEVVAESIMRLVSTFPDLPVVVVCENSPYPPLNLTDSKYKKVKILPRDNDIQTVMNYTRMVKDITGSLFIIIVPDYFWMTNETLNFITGRATLMYTESNDSSLMFATKLHENPDFVCQRILWDGSMVTYVNRASGNKFCEAVTGTHVIVMISDVLGEINDPFELPFPEALYLQRYFKNGKTMILPPLECESKSGCAKIKNKTSKELKVSDTKQLQERRSKFYKKYKIHAVEREGLVELYGCNKNTPRCFPPVIDKPSYVYEGKRTPHCCFVHMTNIAEHVFEVLKEANIRFWLESVSLIAVLSTGKHNTFADHFEIGIYAEDVACVEHLARGGTDSKGFVWQCGTHGRYYIVNLSAINKNNVLILPFVLRNGTMWPDDWTLPHQREFPEWHLNPLEEKYVGDIPFPIPNDPKKFIDHKFGVINASKKFLKFGMEFMYP